MTRTIRTIIGGAVGIAAGIAAYVFLVTGFLDLLGIELGESEWWVPLLTIGIPFIAGLIAGVYTAFFYNKQPFLFLRLQKSCPLLRKNTAA